MVLFIEGGGRRWKVVKQLILPLSEMFAKKFDNVLRF